MTKQVQIITQFIRDVLSTRYSRVCITNDSTRHYKKLPNTFWYSLTVESEQLQLIMWDSEDIKFDYKPRYETLFLNDVNVQDEAAWETLLGLIQEILKDMAEDRASVFLTDL